MPELPEVETTIKGLNILSGSKVVKIKIHTKKLRYTIPRSIFKLQKDSKIDKIERISKFILIHFKNNYSLVLHLGMSGRLKIINYREKREKHDHFIISFNNLKTLVFNDPRKFGFIDFDITRKIHKRKYLNTLGIDALDKSLSANYIYKKIHKSEVCIKQILLNQKIIAGIGNIYASEILFDSKISPYMRGKDLQITHVKKLLRSIRKILKKAIKFGGSSINDYVSTDGTLGNFQKKFMVYDQEGKKISNFKIRKIKQYGRSTYFCPGIQKRTK